MKKIYLIILILSVSLCLLGQENNNKDLAQNKLENEQEERIKLWKEDSRLIMNILSELREYRADNNDTIIQSKYKNEQIKKKLNEINLHNKGKQIKLNKVIVYNVEEEKEKFVVIYFIPIPDDYIGYINSSLYNGIQIIDEKYLGGDFSANILEIKIIKKLTDKAEALKIKKNEIKSLIGKIKSITYEGNSYRDKAEIFLD